MTHSFPFSEIAYSFRGNDSLQVLKYLPVFGSPYRIEAAFALSAEPDEDTQTLFVLRNAGEMTRLQKRVYTR